MTSHMSLLDRYLQAVAALLPAKQRQDILAELRANLQSEMDELAAERGRALTEDEVADMLRQHGHPLAVAARYLPQQHLIGGPWLALYWLVLKISLIVSGTITLLVATVQAFVHTGAQNFWTTVSAYPDSALLIFAWITVVFAALDYFSAREGWLTATAAWNPRKLPSIDLSRGFQQKWSCGRGPTSHLAGAILNMGMLAFVVDWGYTHGSAIAVMLRSSAQWGVVCDLLLASAAIQMFAAFLWVLRPELYGKRADVELACSLVSVAGIGLLISANPWLRNGLRDGAATLMHGRGVAGFSPSASEVIVLCTVGGVAAGIAVQAIVAAVKVTMRAARGGTRELRMSL
jgi:hypothetical protein